MIDYLRQYSKAIVALLAPALVTIGAQAGLNLSDETALTLATLVTGFLVYLVPNKPPVEEVDSVDTAYLEAKKRHDEQMERVEKKLK